LCEESLVVGGREAIVSKYSLLLVKIRRLRWKSLYYSVTAYSLTYAYVALD